jgi:phosphoglycolate phosphatase-like HAD superfamily hydrolase
MVYANYVFDVDGTLTDSRHDIAGAQLRVLRRLGVYHLSEEDLYPFIGRRLEETFSTLLPPELQRIIPEAAGMYLEEYLPHALETTVLFPGVSATLAELRRRGKRLAVASTKRSITIRRVTDHFGISDLFVQLQGTDGLPHKPDPAILMKILRDQNWLAAETLMVGDTDLDILAGRRAGTATCGVSTGALTGEQLRLLKPDHIITNLSDLLELA